MTKRCNYDRNREGVLLPAMASKYHSLRQLTFRPYYHFRKILLVAASCTALLIPDPGVHGPQLKIVHLFYDEWPTGIAISSKGRQFVNYPPDSTQTLL